MLVTKQRPIIFDNAARALFDPDLLEAAILARTPPARPITCNKRVFMHGRYPAISIHGQKLHIHRLLAEHIYGNSHWDFAKMHVHHANGDKLDANISNLEVMTARAHERYHNIGKVLSGEHRRLISERNRQRRGIKHRKRVDIDLQELYSLLDEECSINTIAKHFGCDWSTVRLRIHDTPELLTRGEKDE